MWWPSPGRSGPRKRSRTIFLTNSFQPGISADVNHVKAARNFGTLGSAVSQRAVDGVRGGGTSRSAGAFCSRFTRGCRKVRRDVPHREYRPGNYLHHFFLRRREFPGGDFLWRGAPSGDPGPCRRNSMFANPCLSGQKFISIPVLPASLPLQRFSSNLLLFSG